MAAIKDHSSRAHALLSASSAGRWLACPPSAVASTAYPNQATKYTQEGTIAHEVAEAMARDGYSPKREGVTQEMLDYAAGYADYIKEQTKTEDAMVLLEQRVDFSPWVPDGFGTCDCIILQGDTLTIIDYKYGKGVAVSAEDNPQLKLYALGALHDYGYVYDVYKVEMHIYQPRLNNISVCCLMVEDLMEWAEDTVKPVAQKAAKGKGDYKAGAWCKFCPHAGRCRTLAKTCTEYLTVAGTTVPLPVLAPHEVAEVLAMEPLISLWVKRVKSQALNTLLDGGSVPGYKVVEGKRGHRTWTDEWKVLDALIQAGYKSEAVTETKLLSPAALESSIGKKQVAEVLAGLVKCGSGAPILVPATDKRPAYDRANDFENLD